MIELTETEKQIWIAAFVCCRFDDVDSKISSACSNVLRFRNDNSIYAGEFQKTAREMYEAVRKR